MLLRNKEPYHDERNVWKVNCRARRGLVHLLAFGIGVASVQNRPKPSAASAVAGGGDSDFPVLFVVSQLAILSRVRPLAEPASPYDRPGLEDRGFCVSSVVCLWHSTRHLSLTRRVGRYRDRWDRADRRHEAGQSEPQEKFHRLAVAWNRGSG